MSKARIGQKPLISIRREGASVLPINIKKEGFRPADLPVVPRPPAPVPPIVAAVKPVPAPEPIVATKAQALEALKKTGGLEMKRATMIDKNTNLPPYSGTVRMDGQTFNVTGGGFTFGGVNYAVSKDGKYVMNITTNQIVGTLAGGFVKPMTDADAAEVEYIGRAV